MDNSKIFLNEKVAKKLFKNKKYGKAFSARVISDVIGASFDEVYNNIKLSTDEIAFSAKTLNSTADAICYDDKHYFNIEINFYRKHNKERQLASYTYQLYLGQLHTHKDYPRLKKIIQISIDTFDYFGYNELMYHVYFMEEVHHKIESDDITKVHINLAYIKKLDYNNICVCGNELIKDLYFLTCNDDKKLAKLYKGDKLMKEIIKEAKKIAGTLELDLYATDEELKDMDFQEGKELGIQEGILQNKKEMVLNLLKLNMSIDFITKATGLSQDEVSKIIDEINNN